MPRVSKRKKTVSENPQTKYYRTYLYIRLSEKDGGHGRRDSIYIQKQICVDFVKKHPEMLIMKTYIDNGVTGTTFEREAFEQLMDNVRGGKVDCIIVKDFSRFGRDALDAVDLIDTVFPTLGVRFISVLDEYDSENPSCVENRVNNILKHFMNDYYAREVSQKLIQAHKISREKGEFWGARPPYGFERSPENGKILVPEQEERKIVEQIFYWYVFEDMSSYDIAKELNAMNIPSPAESYELRHYGKTKKKKRTYWGADRIGRILQNPVYIGASVYGKTKQMLCENIPLHLIPREQWDIKENTREKLVERSVYDEAQRISMERWRDTLQIWAANPQKESAANGPFLGHIFCGKCGKRLKRRKSSDNEKYKYFRYECSTSKVTNETGCVRGINEKYIVNAVSASLKYQIQLAVDFERQYGMEFYTQLELEAKQSVRHAKEQYEKYEVQLEQLFEHYATGILDKEEYQEIKSIYLKEKADAHNALIEIQYHNQNLLDRLKAKIDWAEELLRYQNFKEINRGMVERFIDRIIVNSVFEMTVVFWFADIFEQELSDTEGGLSYAI